MCTTLFYYTCVYIYSLLNSCGYWTLNKYYYYYYYISNIQAFFSITNQHIKQKSIKISIKKQEKKTSCRLKVHTFVNTKEWTKI